MFLYFQNGDTALHFAVECNNVEVVAAILDRIDCVDVKNQVR